jgi:hypothetical protein
LIRVVGLFAIVVDAKRWYEEQDFCLLEFANALIEWLEELSNGPTDFVYASLESAEPVLIRFGYVGEGKWQIRSPHEAYREERPFSTDDLRRAAEQYLADVCNRLPDSERVLRLLAEKEEHRPLVHVLRGDAS